MTYEQKSAIVISQLRADRDRLLDAFGKIRAEIEEYEATIDNAISEDELKIEGMKEAYIDCLEIIDKYKAESDPHESEVSDEDSN